MAKGHKTGGRRKGTLNKVSLTVKQSVMDTFVALGGADHMTRWARKHPTEFYKIAARLLPIEVGNTDSKPFEQRVIIVPAKQFRPT